MKAELQIDSSNLVREIVRAVVKELNPLLSDKKQEEKSLFTVESLAKYLSVSKQWVYERVSLNEIPFIKIGKFPRFKKADIEQWLESQKIPAMDPIKKAESH